MRSLAQNLQRLSKEDAQMAESVDALFEKIEDAVIEAQVQKLLDTKKANEMEVWNR